jgi:hypothetical protein
VTAARARALLAVAGARIGLCRDCRPGRICDEHLQDAADAERYRELAVDA